MSYLFPTLFSSLWVIDFLLLLSYTDTKVSRASISKWTGAFVSFLFIQRHANERRTVKYNYDLRCHVGNCLEKRISIGRRLSHKFTVAFQSPYRSTAFIYSDVCSVAGANTFRSFSIIYNEIFVV